MTGNSDFLLSLIIPTKNRQEYALDAIRQAMRLGDPRVQVVVQDNSDTDELKSMLAEFADDPRLKYRYQSGVISFVDNFSLAISASDGRYVCVIGDDDGITPPIVDVTDWADRHGIDAIKPELNAGFYWPGSDAIGDDLDNGYMLIFKTTGKAKWFRPAREVLRLMRNGAYSYLSLDMVKLYHGIVRRECLDRVRALTGHYFGGLSPDMYMAVALSLTVEKAISVDYPLTISGMCKKSGSADSATGRHTGKLEDAPHLRGHSSYEWSDLVPRFYSVETIWADTALAALRDLKRTDITDRFNTAAISAYCARKFPQFAEILREYDQKHNNRRFTLLPETVRQPVEDLIKRIFRKLFIKNTRVRRMYNVKSISEAGEVLGKYLKKIDAKKIISELDKLKQAEEQITPDGER